MGTVTQSLASPQAIFLSADSYFLPLVAGVPANSVILKITASINISHTNVGDLAIRLVDPGLDFIDLSAFEGGAGDNYVGTTFDDSAATVITGQFAPFSGTFRPEESFTELFPGAINGQWYFVIQKNGGTSGTLTSASITITYNAPPVAVAISGALTSVAENTSTATRLKVGDIVVTDDGDGANAVTLTGADAAFFEIIGTELFLRAGTALDYETKQSYSIGVQVDDAAFAGGPEASTSFTLTVLDQNPEIHAGTGTSDTLTGTSSRDAFIFNTPLDKNTNVDIIASFTPVDDVIYLDNAIFKKLKKEGDLKSKFFEVGKKADDGNDFIVYNKKTGAISYDKNGDDNGGAVKFAVIQGAPDDINAANFLVI